MRYPLGSLWFATVLLAALPLPGAAAPATTPIGNCSIVGTYIRLGTADGAGVVLPAAEKLIVVRDCGLVPIPNATVELLFFNCTDNGEFRLCGSQSFPGMGLDCPTHTVWAVSDANGEARFRVRGHALHPGPAGNGLPGAGLGDLPCAEVRADGVILGHLRVKAYDLDGNGGMTPVDLSLFLADRFSSACGPYPRAACASYRSRSDYNDDGTLNPADLALFLQASFDALGHTSCTGATCAP